MRFSGRSERRSEGKVSACGVPSLSPHNSDRTRRRPGLVMTNKGGAATTTTIMGNKGRGRLGPLYRLTMEGS